MRSATCGSGQHRVGRQLAQAHPQPDLVGIEAPVLGEPGGIGGHHQQSGRVAGDGELVGAHGRSATGARPPSPTAWRPASAPSSPSSAPAGPRALSRPRGDVGGRTRPSSSRWSGMSKSSSESRLTRRVDVAEGALGPGPVLVRCGSGRLGVGALGVGAAGAVRPSASSRNRQSSTVCHAHAPGATARDLDGRPGRGDGETGELGHVELGDPAPAPRTSSGRPGSTLASGSPPLATPWARVRARSMRAPPGDEPPMSWSRSPRICSRKLPPAPGPGMPLLAS